MTRAERQLLIAIGRGVLYMPNLDVARDLREKIQALQQEDSDGHYTDPQTATTSATTAGALTNANAATDSAAQPVVTARQVEER